MTKIKTSVSKSVAELIVLGFDDQFEPCGARFAGAKPDIVIKAAHRIGFKAYRSRRWIWPRSRDSCPRVASIRRAP